MPDLSAAACRIRKISCSSRLSVLPASMRQLHRGQLMMLKAKLTNRMQWLVNLLKLLMVAVPHRHLQVSVAFSMD